jgi:hypothetical protein
MVQLLVYCPPSRDLFTDLGWLVCQHEGGETGGGGATPPIDATIRFRDESTYKEKSSVAHQFPQHVGSGKVREDEDREKEDDGVHSFLSTNVYDATMKKRQFITMRVCSCAQVMAFCY